ncbi:MAG TPA: DUF2339 domain-containing protein [Actinomycetota bacterium]|nr:DUF2339 domain-containing protein [Actinomycetota bacterium]
MAATHDLDPRFDPHDSEVEANVLGAWFARLGALALLIGAGFGFKYGVDEGIIGPGLRVLLGIAAGLALVTWGEWSQARGWPRLAQAVSGGGVALLYLTIWSAFQLYELISGLEAFAALTAVAAGGGYLALRYDSRALAVLSTVGGFGNALLIGEGFERPSALFGYVLVLDCVVLGLAYVRGWRLLDHVAFVATWGFLLLGGAASSMLADLSGEEPQTGLVLAYATVYFSVFSALAVARRVGSNERSAASELFLLLANCGIYVLTAMALLTEEGTIPWASSDELRGPVILVAAGVNLVAGLIVRGRNADDPVAGAALASAAMLAAVWVPVQIDPFAVPAAWAALAACMIVVADRTTLTAARLPAYVLLGLSLVYLVGLFSDPGFYDPERILLSRESAAFAVHVASLYVASYGLRNVSEDERLLGGAAAVVASTMTLLWLSLEAVAYFGPGAGARASQSLHFTLNGIWGVYAAVLLAVGIAARIAGARFLALGVFGVTAGKLLLHDVWMLDTLYRTIVFIGLGGIFLACSVMYHRFRDLIVEDRSPA